MANQERILRLECKALECPEAAANHGRHVVTVSTLDPSISAAELMPGTYLENAIGYKGRETEIIGSLAFECPKSGAINHNVLVGETGRLIMAKLTEEAGIEPELVV